jgi:hypothetical protein
VQTPFTQANAAQACTCAIASTQAQKEAAINIIRAGRDHGVDNMTTKLERTAGIDLGGEIDGIPIKLKVGDSGSVEIAVQYRSVHS